MREEGQEQSAIAAEVMYTKTRPVDKSVLGTNTSGFRGIYRTSRRQCNYTRSDNIYWLHRNIETPYGV